MVRYTIENPPITVAYGIDEFSGIFLSVYDKRLEYDESASDEVNRVTESIGPKDGGGCYFDLHTGIMGFGLKVSKETICEFLKRYGVSEEQINCLYFRETENTACSICKSTFKVCNKCKSQYSPCQKDETHDYYIHKFVSCNCESNLAESHSLKRVYGFFLPESSEKPVLTQILIKKVYDAEEHSYDEFPYVDHFLGKTSLDQRSMPRNPLKPEKEFSNTLQIYFRDCFFTDGSKTNTLVQKMTENKNSIDWRGPIVVLKLKGTSIDASVYTDVKFEDLSDVIDYFIWYGFTLKDKIKKV